MNQRTYWRILLFCSMAAYLLAGCATNIAPPTRAPQPSKMRFGTFQKMAMKAVILDEKFADSDANQRAVRKIDEILFRNMRMVSPALVRIEANEDLKPGNERTLEIVPRVKEIKFVGGGARFMVGAMAGSSAVLMQVIYRDSSTGEVIADPEFYRVGNAYSGSMSIGATDNRMLEEIAEDVVNYTRYNQ